MLNATRDAFKADLLISCVPLPNVSINALRLVEAEALQLFEKHLGMLPVCNGEIPGYYPDSHFSGTVARATESVPAGALTLDEFAKAIDAVFAPVCPGSIPSFTLREEYEHAEQRTAVGSVCAETQIDADHILNWAPE